MKTLSLISSFLFVSVVGAMGDAPVVHLEASPLPSGKLVESMPDYAQWQILFSYEAKKSATGENSAAPAPPAGTQGFGRPHLVVYSRTKPYWHGVLVDEFGNKMESWYDGMTPYMTDAKGDYMVMYMNTPGIQFPRFLDYRSSDFPDIQWVSPQNYLGMDKVTSCWVFQQGADGAMVWIDPGTRHPVRWFRGDETRIFQIMDPPTAKLSFPPEVASLSKHQHFLYEVSSHIIPRGG